MKRLILFSLSTFMCMANTSFAVVYITPEAAVQAMEAAYRNSNEEKAVETRNFHEEARRMLDNVNPKYAVDKNMLDKTVQILELAYRKQLREVTFQMFASCHCEITNVSYIERNLAKVTEQCTLSKGDKSIEHLYLFKSNESWRVINLPHGL